MTRPRLSLQKKKDIATRLMTKQPNKEDINAIAKQTKVSSRTVGRINQLIKAGESLTEQDIKNNPDIKKVYENTLSVWIGTMKKRIANITLNNAEKFLAEAGNPAKIKKLSASQAQLSGKIALDTALMATGDMPAGNAPSVKIYLPAASKEGWKVEKVVDAEVVDEK